MEDGSERSEGGLRRVHLRFVGQCQGVGFRWTSQRIAERLHLAGWVRNMWDGSVEMELQGTDDQISDFHGDLHEQFRRWHVEFSIDSSEDVPVEPGARGFRVEF